MSEPPRFSENSNGAVVSRTSLRSIAERGVHLIWTLHFVVTIGLGCTALGLVLLEALMHVFRIPLANPMTSTILLLLALAGVNLPICWWGRHLGVMHLHFLDHESYVLKSNQDGEESFASAGGLYVDGLMDQLEEAAPMDRQVLRRRLRVWLEAHHQELTEGELDDVQSRCPYLFDPAWRRHAKLI
jgi:hypothetical protein